MRLRAKALRAVAADSGSPLLTALTQRVLDSLPSHASDQVAAVAHAGHEAVTAVQNVVAQTVAAVGAAVRLPGGTHTAHHHPPTPQNPPSPSVGILGIARGDG